MSESLTFVQDGSCSRSVRPSIPNSQFPSLNVGCAGNCWQAPAVSHDGGQTWEGGGATWSAPEGLRLLRKVGRADPLALPSEGYAALDKALTLGSAQVWETVKASGLRGRSGSYFPVGTKWETARNINSERKYLLVNAEEGEPNLFKDRHLMEGDPHRVLEGIQIAALGIGATNVVLFINGEAELSRERMLIALEKARAAHLLRYDVEVRSGGGGYVLGEETSLINAIHGSRCEPLARPPFPAVAGLNAMPTVINNAETISNLPDIMLNGAEWYRTAGSPENPGTRLVSLTGDVNRPGLYEVPLGTPLKDIFERWGGGVRGNLSIILAGGPSGSILPASLAETPLDVHTLQAVGGVLGAGGIVALNDTRCPIEMARGLVAYNAHESCGKCTPCREGTVRLLGLFDDLTEGTATAESLETIDYLNDILGFGSLCGLGQMAPNPVRSLLRHFGEDVREHLGGQCRAGVCH